MFNDVGVVAVSRPRPDGTVEPGFRVFMAGGLAVILGLSFLGWFTLPVAFAVYVFELGLVATLQAFIFATLAAIYIGGSVTHH